MYMWQTSRYSRRYLHGGKNISLIPHSDLKKKKTRIYMIFKKAAYSRKPTVRALIVYCVLVYYS